MPPAVHHSITSKATTASAVTTNNSLSTPQTSALPNLADNNFPRRRHWSHPSTSRPPLLACPLPVVFFSLASANTFAVLPVLPPRYHSQAGTLVPISQPAALGSVPAFDLSKAQIPDALCSVVQPSSWLCRAPSRGFSLFRALNPRETERPRPSTWPDLTSRPGRPLP
jgi:hypothetical protein